MCWQNAFKTCTTIWFDCLRFSAKQPGVKGHLVIIRPIAASKPAMECSRLASKTSRTPTKFTRKSFQQKQKTKNMFFSHITFEVFKWKPWSRMFFLRTPKAWAWPCPTKNTKTFCNITWALQVDLEDAMLTWANLWRTRRRSAALKNWRWPFWRFKFSSSAEKHVLRYWIFNHLSQQEHFNFVIQIGRGVLENQRKYDDATKFQDLKPRPNSWQVNQVVTRLLSFKHGKRDAWFQNIEMMREWMLPAAIFEWRLQPSQKTSTINKDGPCRSEHCSAHLPFLRGRSPLLWDGHCHSVVVVLTDVWRLLFFSFLRSCRFNHVFPFLSQDRIWDQHEYEYEYEIIWIWLPRPATTGSIRCRFQRSRTQKLTKPGILEAVQIMVCCGRCFAQAGVSWHRNFPVAESWQAPCAHISSGIRGAEHPQRRPVATVPPHQM